MHLLKNGPLHDKEQAIVAAWQHSWSDASNALGQGSFGAARKVHLNNSDYALKAQLAGPDRDKNIESEMALHMIACRHHPSVVRLHTTFFWSAEGLTLPFRVPPNGKVHFALMQLADGKPGVSSCLLQQDPLICAQVDVSGLTPCT